MVGRIYENGEEDYKRKMLYRKGNQCIGIGSLPNSKRKALWIGSDYCIRKVGSFSNDEAAEDFERYLEDFLGVANNSLATVRIGDKIYVSENPVLKTIDKSGECVLGGFYEYKESDSDSRNGEGVC